MENNTMYDWEKLELQSMDVVLCAGKAGLSRHIQRFQRLTGAPKKDSKLSHAGGIFRYPNTKPLFMQESTTLNKFADKKGVQMNSFNEWLEHYNGKVYVRQLHFNRTRKFYRLDKEFWAKHADDPYENGIMGGLELFLCGLRLDRVVRKFVPSYNPLQTKNPHCTELQGKRLQHHNLIDLNIPTNRMPPWMWLKEIDKWLTVPCGPAIRIK